MPKLTERSTQYGVVLVAISAMFPLMRAFGLEVSHEQEAAVLEFVAAAIGLYALFRRESP
tara:strand:- start:5063 stop:5242 length:180 start_codon:yes stop_codon:yes gene_type:complete